MYSIFGVALSLRCSVIYYYTGRVGKDITTNHEAHLLQVYELLSDPSSVEARMSAAPRIRMSYSCTNSWFRAGEGGSAIPGIREGVSPSLRRWFVDLSVFSRNQELW